MLTGAGCVGPYMAGATHQDQETFMQPEPVRKHSCFQDVVTACYLVTHCSRGEG